MYKQLLSNIITLFAIFLFVKKTSAQSIQTVTTPPTPVPIISSNKADATVSASPIQNIPTTSPTVIATISAATLPISTASAITTISPTLIATISAADTITASTSSTQDIPTAIEITPVPTNIPTPTISPPTLPLGNTTIRQVLRDVSNNAPFTTVLEHLLPPNFYTQASITSKRSIMLLETGFILLLTGIYLVRTAPQKTKTIQIPKLGLADIII